MKIKIKNGLTDILNFGKHIKLRNKIFSGSPDNKIPEGKINLLAKSLHPTIQKLIITQVIEEAPGIKTFRLKPKKGEIAPFRAGQYVSLSYKFDGLTLSRPYSLSSSPTAALRHNYYDITIKETTEGAFFSQVVFSHWKQGTRIDSSGPSGTFYYESLRDSSTILCLAGGSGITPFRSIITEELKNHNDNRFYLFYGFNTPDQEIFKADFQELQERYPKRFFHTPVCMSPECNWKGKSGTLSLNLLKESLNEDELKKASLFICGPQALHEYMDRELSVLNLERKQIRRENFSPSLGVSEETTYQLTILERGKQRTAVARTDETLITALERAGINPPVLCRAGECGWCRSQLIKGEIETDDRLTGLRGADKKFNWIHPCVCYPKSDITIRVPHNPAANTKEIP